VLAFTPAVESALRWFDATHDLDVGFGAARWRLTRLPGPGSLGEQDAALMAALDWLRQIHDDLVAPPPKMKTPIDDD
jgi:hypothetical protein